MTIACDAQLMNNIIEEFGETIYLLVANSRTLTGVYAEETVSWTQYKIKGIINFYSADCDEVREGNYYTGEITFLLDTDYETLATPKNKIYYPTDGNWYEIKRLRKNRLADTTYVLEVTVDRLESTSTDTVQTSITSSSVIA